MLQGGFSAWEKQGLDVQSTGVDYQTTVFDSLSDEAEGLVERASSIFRQVLLSCTVNTCNASLLATVFNIDETVTALPSSSDF